MESDWDFYLTSRSDQVLSIYLDLRAYADESRAQRPFLLVVFAVLRQPNGAGLSTNDEAPTLYAIEDALVSQLQPLGAQYVARVTGQGRRDFLFYVPGGSVDWPAAAKKAMGAFLSYEYRTKVDPDPEWSIYRQILYPTDRDFQSMRDREVVEVLKKSGDTLEIPRFLNHWVSFGNPANRQAFVDQTEARGFLTRSLHEADKGEDRYWAVLERKDSVQLRDINSVTLELFDLAQSYGGHYDGWECKVVKSPEDAKEY